MLNKLKEFICFLKDILLSRRLIFELSKNDFKVKYAGSYLGIIWAFVQPIITILVFWFVFQVGFKSAPVQDFPFILWLICGMVPWFFFSEALNNATGSLIAYSYLVKKVVFRVSILPIVKIISSLFVHIFFIVFIFIMFFLYGYEPSIYNIQVVYYSFAMTVLLLGLSWITSSIIVFLKDTSEIVAIILQFGFWLTPIFWSYKTLPIKYAKIFKLNPMYYIVEGYRDTFINHVWFWERYNQTFYFWVVTFILFMCGALLFRKLRPHFSDVL
ncbi:ABC transporter permease [Tepidibacter sp. Z1-5]|uniref:ABC transporter permease n=1 Tax=Tepidibacter sp. Z1-5 TaxID=3134138 RepID=UPI0030C02370